MALHHDLSVPDALVLLALEETSGRTHRTEHFDVVLGGAVAAELLLDGRLRLQPGPDGDTVAAVADRRPTGDAVLDEALALVAGDPPAPLGSWIPRFGSDDLKHRVAAGLCRRGVLRSEEEKVLLLFSRRVYPEVDPRPERELVTRLHDVVFEDGPVSDPRAAVIAGLAHRTGLLTARFGKEAVAGREERLASLVGADPATTATDEALREVQAALSAAVAATMAAATAASAACSASASC